MVQPAAMVGCVVFNPVHVNLNPLWASRLAA